MSDYCVLQTIDPTRLFFSSSVNRTADDSKISVHGYYLAVWHIRAEVSRTAFKSSIALRKMRKITDITSGMQHAGFACTVPYLLPALVGRRLTQAEGSTIAALPGCTQQSVIFYGNQTSLGSVVQGARAQSSWPG